MMLAVVPDVLGRPVMVFGHSAVGGRGHKGEAISVKMFQRPGNLVLCSVLTLQLLQELQDIAPSIFAPFLILFPWWTGGKTTFGRKTHFFCSM